jgi:putative copper export protein
VNYSVDAFSYAAIRFAIYAAVLGLLGACAFVLLVVRRVRGLGLASDLYAEEAAAKAKRMALVCACVLAVALPARLIAQSLVLFDAPFEIVRAIPVTNWGRAWLLQVAGVVLAFIALSRVRETSVRAWRVAAVGGAAVALGFSLSGHATAARIAPMLAVIVDCTHMIAAGSWAGTLAALAFVGLPVALGGPEETRGSTALALVNAFSPLALFSAGVLVVTGTFSAWEQLGSFAMLFSTQYGRQLIVKLAAVALMMAIGAINWRMLKPKLGTEPAARAIRRSALREVTVAAFIILTTAYLVASNPHGDDAMDSASAATAR